MIEEAAARQVAKYGGEALLTLRRGLELLEWVTGVAKLRSYGWARQAEVWRSALIQVVGQIEDTDLSTKQDCIPKEFAGIQTIKRCIREHLTLVLHTQKVDGTRRNVEVEPYALKTLRGEMTLICYNVDHAHLEQLPLYRILYSWGDGIHFAPRYPSYIEGEDDAARSALALRDRILRGVRELETLTDIVEPPPH